jgi:uncharacterized protein (DUF4415 family)
MSVKAKDPVEARLAALAEPDLNDPDNPEWTETDFAKAVRPGDPGFPKWLYDAFPRTKRGRPRSEKPKVPVNLRIDADVLAAFKAGGRGWQTRMNEALRASLKGMSRPAGPSAHKTKRSA